MEGFRELIELHLAEQGERGARKRQEVLREQVLQLDESLAEARTKLAKAQERLDLVTSQRRLGEAEVEQLDANRSKYRRQLMEAKTNEVYRTLLSEIETAAKAISERETSILELMERIDAVESVVAEAKAELQTAEGENRAEARQLEAEIARLGGVRAEARERVEQLREVVPKRLLPTYDRILEARDSKALSLCEAETCSECHVAVRPQVWVEIRKETKIHNCGGCGRILYRAESIETVSAGGDDPRPAEGN